MGVNGVVACLWRSLDWLRRIDVIVLVLMFFYAVSIAARAFYRLQIVGTVQRPADTGHRKAICDLNAQARRLKSIFSVAPYLGLLGTVLGIMDAPGMGHGIAMEASAARRLISSGIAESLVIPAVAILVTVLAICSHNYLCTRIDLLTNRGSGKAQGSRQTVTGSLSLPSAFSLVAATGLAILVAAYTPYFDPHRTVGLLINLVSTRCEYVQNDRVTVLHVTNAGKLFIDDEEEDWGNLTDRLSEIYSVREYRTLDLLVDKELSFQTVAELIDIVAGVENAARTEPLNIQVRLITPAALNAGCAAIPLSFVPGPT